MPADDALPTTRAELDELVTWATIRAARGFEHMLTEVLLPFDLSPVQFGALCHLAVEPFLTQAQLAHRILVRPQSANHLLDVLIGRGLVERTAERGSGRRNPVRLTAAGRRLLARAWPAVAAANTPASLGLTERQHRQLATVVNRALLAQTENEHPPRGSTRAEPE